MKWMRRTALGIGIAFGGAFIVIAIGEAIGGEPSGPLKPSDIFLLATGPISIIIATCIAWKYERVGGWWLVIAGIINAILFAVRLSTLPWHPRRLTVFLFFSLPLLVAGSLWLIHAANSENVKNRYHGKR